MEEFKEKLDYYCDYKNHDITCFLDLGNPIDETYIETHRKSNRYKKLNEYGLEERNDYPNNLMDDLEANYALSLIKTGLVVYREPHLRDCCSIADFYIYHQELKEGVLVEITRYGKKHHSKKKREQHENLRKSCQKYNIPFIPLFLEDLEIMGLTLTTKKLTS